MVNTLLRPVLVLSLLVISFYSTAQHKPTQAEIQKMAKEMMDAAQGGKELSEADMKAMVDKLGGEKAMLAMEKESNKKSTQPKVIKPNVPLKALTGKPLLAYIRERVTNMNSKMDPVEVEGVYDLIKELDSSAVKVAQLSVYAFYKGAVNQGVLLAANACLLNPANDLNLNNFAGMLNIVGAPDYALPILKGLFLRFPNNAMILNNVGQSFAALGMKDSAMKYLDRAMKSSPGHRQANQTAAKLASKSAVTPKSLAQARESMKVVPTEEAAQLIEQNDPSPDRFAFLVRRNEAPDYFNLYKFKKPRHPRNADESNIAEAERRAFLMEVERMKSELSDIAAKEGELGTEQLKRDGKRIQDIIMTTGKNPGLIFGSQQIAATKVIAGNKKFQNDDLMLHLGNLKDYQDFYEEKRKQLASAIESIHEEYKRKLKPYECGEGRAKDCMMIEQLMKESCKKQNEKINEYYAACAEGAERYEQKILLFAREHFFFDSKWQVMSQPNQHLANATYYQCAIKYLETIKRAVGFDGPGPACRNLDKLLLEYKFGAFGQSPCPVNLDFEVGIISMKLNCEEAEFGVEVIDDTKLHFRKDFKKNQSTLSVIHTSLEGKVNTPDQVSDVVGIDIDGSVEVTESAFITIDGDGKVVDIGVKGSATAEGEMGVHNGQTEVDLKLDLKAELTIGINSGFTFEGANTFGFL